MAIISKENCTNNMCDVTISNSLLQKIIAYIYYQYVKQHIFNAHDFWRQQCKLKPNQRAEVGPREFFFFFLFFTLLIASDTYILYIYFNEELYYFKKPFRYSFCVLRVLTLCKSDKLLGRNDLWHCYINSANLLRHFILIRHQKTPLLLLPLTIILWAI